MMEEERTTLEEFLIDNPELERLEALLDEFNIFEALGAVKVELRHSEFLAFLMNPHQNHGLDDVFVKRFLQKALTGIAQDGSAFTAIYLDIWNLDDLEVRREWHNIDILLLSEANQLAIIIENKIESSEHSNQLSRYYQSVEAQFHGWKILGLYLTPEGDDPSDERYLPVSYEIVCTLIENISESRKSTLGPDIHTLMQHYTTMLRRHILSGSKIEELCQKIYRKHQRALDLIFEYRPDQQAELAEFLRNLVDETPDIIMDTKGKTRTRFVTNNLDHPTLRQGKGWTPSGRMLLFELVNRADKLNLYLIIGPGPAELREDIFAVAIQKEKPLRPSQGKLSGTYQTIYRLGFLTSGDYQKMDLEGLQAKVEKVWARFLENDLPKITSQLKEKSSLWAGDSTGV
jgi:hypothetical protein